MKGWILQRRQHFIAPDALDEDTLREAVLAGVDPPGVVVVVDEVNFARAAVQFQEIQESVEVERAEAVIAAPAEIHAPRARARKVPPPGRPMTVKQPKPSKHAVEPVAAVSRATIVKSDKALETCIRCGEPCAYNSKIVLANVYVDGTWNRIERFHIECYDAAGHPHGAVGEQKATGDGELPAVRSRKCRVCKVEFDLTPTTRNALTCPKHRTHKAGEPDPPQVEKTCVRCGRTFTTKMPSRTVCSGRCPGPR